MAPSFGYTVSGPNTSWSSNGNNNNHKTSAAAHRTFNVLASTLMGDKGGETLQDKKALLDHFFPRVQELSDDEVDRSSQIPSSTSLVTSSSHRSQNHYPSSETKSYTVSEVSVPDGQLAYPDQTQLVDVSSSTSNGDASESPVGATGEDDTGNDIWIDSFNKALSDSLIDDTPLTSDYSDKEVGAALPQGLADSATLKSSSSPSLSSNGRHPGSAAELLSKETARVSIAGAAKAWRENGGSLKQHQNLNREHPQARDEVHEQPTHQSRFTPSESLIPAARSVPAPPRGQVRRILGQSTSQAPPFPSAPPQNRRYQPHPLPPRPALMRPNLPRPMSGPPRHFEIRIDNIPHGSKVEELYRLLGDLALHRKPFSNHGWKMNFWIHLPRAKPGTGNWGKLNDGHGFLTLPDVKHARKFLDIYGQNVSGRASSFIRPSYAKEPLKFSPGNRSPPAGILEWLNRVPYPEKGDRSQRVQYDRMAESIELARMEFGVFCRDGVFSPEYIKKMAGAKFAFDYGRKQFRILLNLQGRAAGSSPPITRSVVIKSSAIRLILSSISEGECSNTLIMHHAPAFEGLQSREENPENEGQTGAPSGSYNGRQRRGSFDSEHGKTAAFVSRVIRLVFDSEAHRSYFEDLLAHIGCPAAKYVRLEDEPRRIYSTSKRKQVHDWLESLDNRAVAFQLARLYQNNLLVPRELLSLKAKIMQAYAKDGPFVLADVLHQYVEDLTRLEDKWYDRLLRDKGYEDRKLEQGISIEEVFDSFVQRGLHRIDWRENYDSPVMQCLHVILTPTSMILEGPYPDQSNRPLRKYGHHDHFIRVAFQDEDKSQYYWTPDIDWTTFLDERVGAILRGGIRLGGRCYDFLGYSMSSLRNRSTWFCTPFEWHGIQVNASYIRDNLGDFERVKRQPARFGARMAQAFTATDPSLVLRPDQIEVIDDVEKEYNGEIVCFTDGVGKISIELTRKVWAALHGGIEPLNILPSAFQFRLGGYKGVLTVDSELEGEKICVRRSQQKFDAPDSLGLEIAYTYCRHMYMFLNRPLIKVLEDLQVPHHVFMDLLRDTVKKAEELKQYVRETRRQLTLHGLGGPYSVTDLVESIASLLKTNKIEPFKEGGHLTRFFAESLEFAEVHILRMLKLKARIPVVNAHVGVAVADESGVLKEGEIYTLRHNPGEEPQLVEGDVLLVRAPTVDVGDVQFAKAVGTPPPGAERFKHLPNIVIFSIHGKRPLLSSLARGDMDGDVVGVITDRRLFPKKTEPPMQHKPKKPVDLDYDCTVNEVIDFVLRFFRNDILGSIANRHLLIADQSPGGFHEGCGTRHPSCKKLAELQAIAVDAPKSGQSIDLDEIPRALFPHRPDFMRHDQVAIKGEDDEALIYHSHKILGKLYRAIRLSSREEDNQVIKEPPPLDVQYIPGGEDDHVLTALIEEFEACGLSTNLQPSDINDREQAWYTLHSYASDLRHIAWSNTMTAGHPLSEHELFIGTILHGPLVNKTKQDLVQRINLQCKELIDSLLNRLEGPDGRDKPQLWVNRILAALRVAVSQGGNFGAQTFGAIAIKSALYLLVLMKDVRQTDYLTSYEYGEDQPFQSTVSTLDDGGFGEGRAEDDMPFVIASDAGGELGLGNDEIIIEH